MNRLFFLAFCLFYSRLCAQPVADFIVENFACRNTALSISNLSTGADSYKWDFCYGGLSSSPVGSNSITINGATASEGINLVKAGTQWYGFIANTNSNGLLRLDYGTSLNNNPTVTNLSNPSGVLDRPRDIAVIKSGSNWFGLVTCFNVGQGTTKLVHLSFGTSLLNLPVAIDLGNIGGRFSQAYAVEWVADNGEWIGIVGDRSQRKLVMINFGSNPGNTIFSNASFREVSLTSNGFLKDISLLKDLTGWKAVVIGENRNVWKVTFPGPLFSTPTIVLLTSSVALTGFPNNVALLRDNDEFYAIILQFEGDVIRLDFGFGLENDTPTATNLGRLGTLSSMQGLAFAREGNNWIGFSNSVLNQLKKITFTSVCSASIASSEMVAPSVSYSTTGAKPISLEVSNAFGEKTFAIRTVVLKTNPNSDFRFQKNCADQATEFIDMSTDDGSISSWLWSFGDLTSGTSNTSTSRNPEYTYATAGQYQVTLTITDDCGDTNQITKDVLVNDPAAVTLNISAPSETCSFEPFNLSPQTSPSPSLVSQINWNFGDGNTSNAMQPTHRYAIAGNFLVSVTALVDQCLKSNSRNIIVKEGLQLESNIVGQCEDAEIAFMITNSAENASYQWDFGDGNSAFGAQTQHSYTASGEYRVGLQATLANGCINSTVKPLTIYSQPQPNFSLDLPPFSCAGTPSQFNDLTPAPDDSNIAQWQWNFGVADATSANQNPTYTYTAAGEYDVSLTTTTNFGCQASTQKRITIAPSPSANFTAGAACVNQGTQFQATGTDIKSWQWTILTSSYNLSAPLHVFTSPGEFTAALTVVGDNDCIASANQLITVPIVPTLDFSATNLCAGQAANFQDATGSFTVDPIVSRNWSANNQSAAMGSQVSYTFNDAGNYSVALTTIHQSGCTYTLSKSIAIAPVPVANFSATPEWGVPPLNVQFNNNSSGASAYLWKFNDAMGSTSTAFSPTFIFTQLGEYVVDLTATNAQGCSTSKSQKISVVIPSFDLSLEQLEITEDPNNSAKRLLVTIKNQSNFPVASVDVTVFISGASAIRETLNTTLQPGASVTQLLNSQILNSTPPLSYLCVELNGSDDQDLVNNKRCESINAEPVLFSPYPNPASNFVGFDWIATSTAALQVLIYNQSGQLVYEKTVTPENTGLIQVSFDLRPLTAGLYFMKLVSSQYSTTRTFAIVR